MDVGEIRSLRLANPFKPFTLVLSDGRRLPVDLPFKLAISPRGNELAYASRRERGPIFIHPNEVQEVAPGVEVGQEG